MLFFSLAFFQDSARKTFLLYHRLPLQQVFTSLNSSSDLQGHTCPGSSPRPMQNTAAGKLGAARATRPASAQHLWSQVLLKKQGSGPGKGGVWAGLETPIQTSNPVPTCRGSGRCTRSCTQNSPGLPHLQAGSFGDPSNNPQHHTMASGATQASGFHPLSRKASKLPRMHPQPRAPGHCMDNTPRGAKRLTNYAN